MEKGGQWREGGKRRRYGKIFQWEIYLEKSVCVMFTFGGHSSRTTAVSWEKEHMKRRRKWERSLIDWKRKRRQNWSHSRMKRRKNLSGVARDWELNWYNRWTAHHNSTIANQYLYLFMHFVFPRALFSLFFLFWGLCSYMFQIMNPRAEVWPPPVPRSQWVSALYHWLSIVTSTAPDK